MSRPESFVSLRVERDKNDVDSYLFVHLLVGNIEVLSVLINVFNTPNNVACWLFCLLEERVPGFA